MKLPDFLYIKQTRVLNNLHDFSVELLARLYSHDNPVDAYNAEWGERQISNLTVSIETSLNIIGKERAGRLLRRKMSPPGFTQRAELDRDVLRIETLQLNLELELENLFSKKVILLGWIATGLLLAILACQLLRFNG